MPEYVIWIAAGTAGIPSLAVIFWPMKRYESVTKREEEKG